MELEDKTRKHILWVSERGKGEELDREEIKKRETKLHIGAQEIPVEFGSE